MSVRYDDTGPDDVEWFVKAGDPVSKTWLLTDPNDPTQPIDVSTATITAVVVNSATDFGTPVATFTTSKPSVADDNAVKVLLSSGVATVGSYWWAVKVALADGETVYRGEGPFIVETDLGL